MKLNLLVSTSQINSQKGRLLGTGSVKGLIHLAEIMAECGIYGDIYDLPNGSRNPAIASPFSLNNGFALTTDELDLFDIPELEFDPVFNRHLQQLHQTNQQYYASNRTVSYTLKRTLTPWVIEHCYSLFRETASAERKEEFTNFCTLASYWLDNYALYKVYKEQSVDLHTLDYQNSTGPDIVEFKKQNDDRLNFYRYEQLLCFQQRKATHKKLQNLGIGLIVNLPFGVEFDSADVFFCPEVFEADFQVGCSPEPEHGYPEQAWGVAVYKERSPELQRYLSEKMRWLSLLGDGVFLDHLVGWCGQYVVPQELPEDSVYPYGHFLTENHQERVDNLIWFLEIINQSGLEIRGEVAGDAARVKATREGIDEFKKRGKTISAMAIPRWEAQINDLIPLLEYEKSTLMMVETHDTSTLIQYMLNKKGYFDDFETPRRILEFCNRILALPFLPQDTPLELKKCSESFWREIFARLCCGTSSEDIVFTLPGLISLLSPKYRSPTIENNINVKPGTSGRVGNGWRNWSYFSPPIETMINDPDLKQALTTLGKREYKPFDYFHILETGADEELGLHVLFSKPAGRGIIYQDTNSCWRLLSLSEEAIASIHTELIIGNVGEAEIWYRINLESVIDLEKNIFFSFQDLNGNRDSYNYSSDHIKNEHFFVKLQPNQVHHFLVFEQGALEQNDFSVP